MKPGGVLYTSKTYAHAVALSEHGKQCEQCLVSIEDQGIHLKKCAKCKIVYYCSVDCQSEDWTFHKLECKCFQAQVSIPSQTIILLSRLLQRHHRGDNNTVSETICGRKVVFNDLVHHVEDIMKDRRRLTEFGIIMEDLQTFLGEHLAFPTLDEMLKIYGRVRVNAFKRDSHRLSDQQQGISLFLGLSAIDHSCRSNAQVDHDGNTVTLQTLIDVPDAALGTYCDKIRISYIDPLNLTVERRSALREHFYFTCNCPMCTDQHLDALMQSIKCPQPNCDGPVVRQEAGQVHVCTRCNEKFSNNSDVITKYNSLVIITKSTLNILEELRENRHTETFFNKAEELLKLQTNTFHKMNVYRVKTLSKAADGAYDTRRYKKAIKYALATLEAYEQCYCGEYNSKVGLCLMTIGVSLVCDGQVREAYDFLQRAESILAVTHGSGKGAYDLVKETLDKCVKVLTELNFL